MTFAQGDWDTLRESAQGMRERERARVCKNSIEALH